MNSLNHPKAINNWNNIDNQVPDVGRCVDIYDGETVHNNYYLHFPSGNFYSVLTSFNSIPYSNIQFWKYSNIHNKKTNTLSKAKLVMFLDIIDVEAQQKKIYTLRDHIEK